MQIIPAIDIYQDQCVRLTEGKFRSRTDYQLDPYTVAQQFVASGARCLHVVDLEGAKEGKIKNWKSIRRILSIKDIAVQIGGGVRSDGEIERLVGMNADRIVVGSVALQTPKILERWVQRFGSDRFVIALDVLDGHVALAGWQVVDRISVEKAIPRYVGMGVGRILSTDIRRDGTMNGPNLEMYTSLVRKFPRLELLASGGVRTVQDVHSLKKTGVFGVIIGKALYEGQLRLEELLKDTQC